MSLKKAISFLIIFFLGCQSLSVMALTPKDQKGVITIESPALSYKSPTRFTPFALEDAPEDISYWTSIIPHPEDRNADMYVVLPTLGLITPVIFVPEGSADHKAMTSGKEIDINKYLTDGVMHYANSGMPGDVGNPVIFGHSNYFEARPGRYKSIFADIMNLDVGATDEMRTYTKEGGEYVMRKFTIEESYETTPTDVGILKPKGGKELTVFACTNGLEGRWILRGKLIEDNEVLVPYVYKYQISDKINALKGLDDAQKKRIIIEGVKEIEQIRAGMSKTSATFDDKMQKYVLNYLERELVKVY